MRNFRNYGLCAVAAAALLAAGCGGGSNTRPEPPAPARTAPTPAAPTPAAPTTPATPATPAAPTTRTTPADAVDLQGQTVTAGEYMIDAGMTMKVDGVRFWCSGDTDCTVTVAEDGMSATSSAGMVMAAMLDATGNQAFMNLSAALLNTADSDTVTDGVQSVFNDLRMNRYHDGGPDVEAMPDADPAVVGVDNGGGVTTSLTTHEEPASQGSADPLTGVSDIAVTVMPSVVRYMDSDASKEVSVVDAGIDDEDANDEIVDLAMYDQVRDDAEVDNPVLVDGDGMITSGRTANFVATADWDRNPAAEWTTDPALMGWDPMEAFWTYAFDSSDDGQPLSGGRTLHLDLRSDFNPNAMTKGDALLIATGPNYEGGQQDRPVGVANSSADWADVKFDGMRDVPMDGERDLTTDAMGIPGSYMGVKGVFVCIDGQSGQNDAGICRINQHSNGKLGVSEGDAVQFMPYMYTEDTDWLAAGVWLTIPDDEEDGDYAIGAFVYGNDPYKPEDATAAESITGKATYEGQAFGRYAEVDGANTETGRFTAAAMLMADFGDGSEMGTIHGSLADFVANGQSETWSANFESANIMMGMTDDATPQVIPDSALRFNAGASGHARGHGLTGYWNGQFYGSPAANASDDDLQPGSAAGTFGLTTERDNEDNYSLTMGGAFAAHWGKKEE